MNISELVKRYNAEKKKWKMAGKPMRDPNEMEVIYNDICSKCPHFLKGQGWVMGYDKCEICQCNLHKSHKTLNKLAWGTTHCPDEPPKWVESSPKP